MEVLEKDRKKGEKIEKQWRNIFEKKNNKIKNEFERILKGELPISLDKTLLEMKN